MQSLNEYNFTMDYVIPLFQEMGYYDVRYVGGSDEYGRDVLCYEIDRAGTRIDVGIQVKDDPISGNSSAQEIIYQIKTAYENIYIDIHTQTERHIGKIYVITSRHITNYCKRIIKSGVHGYPVYFMDGKMVLDKRNSQISTYLEYSTVEILMNQISFTDLLKDGEWVRNADEMLILLFEDKENSPLQCINTLPNLLIANAKIKTRVESLDNVRRKSVLHWLSIKLVLRAYYTMAKTSKFSLITEVVR